MNARSTDPDFGTIDLGPPPTRKQFDEATQAVRKAVKAHRVWPPGSVGPCPRCGAKAFASGDDLSHRVARPGGVVVFRRLQGARCQSCGAQSLEPADQIVLEEEASVGIVAGYEAKVSTIGSGSLGTYWPKDVVRTLRLAPHGQAFIQVIDADTVLVRFGPRPRPQTSPARRRKRR